MKNIKLNFFVVCVVLLFFCASTLAQESTEITELGKPIRDIQAAKDQWKYFKINVQTTLQNMKDTDTLSVLVTPYSGDADLYIDANNYPTTDCTTCWRSTSPHGDIISLTKADEKWPRGTPASLFIGVFARSLSMFTVNTWVTGTHIQLDDGEPQTAKALARQYTYFDYVLDDASNITIAVTPISGDPDIYASVDIFEPNTTSYTWHSRDWGYDLIHIRNGRDPRYVPGPATYHIGVYAFTDTYFTMSINKDTSYTTLVEGVPLTNNVDRQKYQYFKFYLASPRNLILIVNPLTSRGDPDIYVNFGEAEPKPNRETARWKSLGSGIDTLTITDAAAGWYYIAIYGYSFSNFQLTATVENKNVLLYDGIKQYNHVNQGAYTYYKYYHGDAESSLSISVMPFGADLMDVFISKTNPNPTGEEGKFDYRAFHVGQQSVVSINAPVRVGNYYIGVYGRTSGNFSIVAATNQSHTLLREGDVSFWNSVPKGYYRYFLYDIHDFSRDQDITITANPWRGEVDLYVDPFVPFPKEGNATFVSRFWRQDTIVINGHDPRLGNSRRLYIGVHGYSEAYFSITAFLSNTTLEIKDGFSVPGATEAGKTRYYKFYMPNAGSITINLELADSGNTEANLYASTRAEKPSPLDNQWASTNFGSDVINIDYLPAGWIYIGAYGVIGQRIRYVITARVNHQVLTVNRVSMLSYNAYNTTSNFQAFVWQECDYLLAAVSLISGRTNLYISSNGTASKDRSQWKSTTWPGNAILITRNDPNWGRFGYWNLQVEALANSDYYISLVCASNQPSFTYGANLAEGIARLGIAPAQGFILYMFRVNYDWNTQKVTDDYSIYIRSIKNPVNVYAHQDYRIPPSPRNNTFHSSGSGDRIMTIKKETLSFGYLYIALYGAGSDAYYEITVAKANSPRYLLQEQPQSIAAESGASNYFRVLSARGAANVYAYVESCDNNPPPTLYADLTNQYPTEGKAQFKSNKKDDYLQQLAIPFKPDPTTSESPRQIYLGVKNTSPLKQIYSVFASNDLEDSRPIVPNTLMFGAPFNGNQFILKFTRAKNPAKFADRALTYTVFKHHAELENGNPVKVNFDTPCGVKINGGRGDGIATNFNPIDNTFEYIMNYEPGRVYRVNVIVTDDLGLASAYEPVWVIDGRVYNSWPGIFLFHVSIGFVLILVVFLLFTGYFAFGSIINVIRGKRGLQVVPNVDFWRELPFIILDGIKFLVTCGKVPASYSNFQDEAPTVNTSGFEHAPAAEEKKEETKAQPSSGGYGAI